MNVAIQRIRDYLLSEECQLPKTGALESTQTTPSPKKKVTILGNRNKSSHNKCY